MTLSLIYDRTAADVQRMKQLAAIGWQNMTAAEKTAWLIGESLEVLMASDGELRDSGNQPIQVIGSNPMVKGAYNYTDLNRVESAVAYLVNYVNDLLTDLADYEDLKNVAPDELFELGYSAISLTTKTDWAENDLFSAAQGERYLNNIIALSNLIALDGASPLPDSMGALTYEGANAIEKLLALLETQSLALFDSKCLLVENAAKGFIYSAEVYAGEV